MDGEQPQLADGTLGCCHGGGGEGPPDAARPHRGRQGSRQRLAPALACTEQPAQPGGALDAAAMAAHGFSCLLGLQHNSPRANTRGPEVSAGSEGNDGLKLGINGLGRHGGQTPIELGLEQGKEVPIAGEVVVQIGEPIIEGREGPAGEGRGHGVRSEGHRRAGGGCQGRPTSRCAAQRSQCHQPGRLCQP